MDTTLSLQSASLSFPYRLWKLASVSVELGDHVSQREAALLGLACMLHWNCPPRVLSHSYVDAEVLSGSGHALKVKTQGSVF